jgi:hypothetical protein
MREAFLGQDGQAVARTIPIGDSSERGTPNTGVSAVEGFSGSFIVTKLSFTALAIGAIAAGASEAIGKKIYTFPAGRVIVLGASMAVALSDTADLIDADTPDGGLGTLIGSGAAAVLSTVGAAAENILTGQTFNDVNGTQELKTVATTLVIEAADSHDVFFNLADGWAGADAGVKATGEILLLWLLLEG